MGNMRKSTKIKKWGNTKRIVIENASEEKKDLLEDLVGTVSLPKDLDKKNGKSGKKTRTAGKT